MQIKNTQLVHCGFIINCGSQNDGANPGMAHALEHMIFKGTKNRNNRQILSYIDNVGGEINAYTTRDYTAVYCTVHKRFAARAVELLSDLVSNSTFPQNELSKEKKVIIEEIKMYLDSPEENIIDEFFEKFLGSHPLAHNILGTQKSVNAITQQAMQQFYTQHYTTANMVFSIVGNITLAKSVAILEKQQLIISNSKINNVQAPANPIYFNQQTKQKNTQAHIIIGMPAPANKTEEGWTMLLINNLLGGFSMNNRLNMSIREKHGLAYHVESSYQRFAPLGVFSIYIGCHSQEIEKCIALVHKELQKMCSTMLGKNQLSVAKNQIIGQTAIAEENYSATMLSMGKSILNHGFMISLPEALQKIQDISASQVLELSNKVFNSNQMATLIYLPK